MTPVLDRVPIDQPAIIEAVDRETAALLRRLLGGFLELDLQGEPLFDEVTGGHVLTHLSREADRMADELLAATGRPLPEYDADRRWDVERGGLRPGAVLIDDFIESSERLAAGMHGVQGWSSLDQTLRVLPTRRLVQLLIHHADLERPWEDVADTDAAIAVSFLPILMPTELSDIRLVARTGQDVVVAERNDDRTVIVGKPRDLLGWACGRTHIMDETLPRLTFRTWF
ncbi:maleylpyruvate isomerase family mycothiol-dependent enzyme [Agromyces salentinus]|uniref:Mycothiol-dependent maleylpyruvate isomerase metal-binding domain-containing protein n=1 Tax=Agromyces salentinus TaxID=269421 RepID=A0ABN2N2U9_9MICO|nr:maleylpyruvate isomerase family mycothiol-dependent enzyme [Agromyces salentinus]